MSTEAIDLRVPPVSSSIRMQRVPIAYQPQSRLVPNGKCEWEAVQTYRNRDRTDFLSTSIRTDRIRRGGDRRSNRRRAIDDPSSP